MQRHYLSSEGKEEERQSVEVREAVVSRVGHSFVATGTYNVDCYLCCEYYRAFLHETHS